MSEENSGGKQAIKKFLSCSEILIVDNSASSSKGLIQVLSKLGANKDTIHVSFTLEDAMKSYTDRMPKVILADYYIPGGSGLDLFQRVRLKNVNYQETALILVTSNPDQSIVAKAAEEEVDAYILKPYTQKAIEETLEAAILMKITPPEYYSIINKGKQDLAEGELTNALESFEQAVALSETPALAFSYKGETKEQLENLEEAEQSFQRGLSYNKIHLKSLQGLYQLYAKMERKEEAYKTAKELTKYFPSNQERLCNVIKLCVETENYQDVQDYYGVFKELDERSPGLTAYVNASLFVAGKFHAINGNLELAKDHFVWLVASSQGNPKFLYNIIKVLCRFNDYETAKNFLKRFDVDDLESDEYKASSYLAEYNDIDDNQRMKYGLEVFSGKTKDPHCFQLLINSMKNKDMDERISKLLEEAESIWPDRKFAA